MIWQRLHCVECWHDMEHCATCGCHDTVPVMSTESEQGLLNLYSTARKKAPAANEGQPTTTDGESK